jgi:hypothetical protein
MKNIKDERHKTKENSPIRIIVEAHYNDDGKGLEHIFADVLYTQLKNKVA